MIFSLCTKLGINWNKDVFFYQVSYVGFHLQKLSS